VKEGISMPKKLPPNLHIDSLKKQARQLLNAFRRAEPEALKRIDKILPDLPASASRKFTLRQAQQLLAREYGFSSWQKLSVYIGPSTNQIDPKGESMAILSERQQTQLMDVHQRLATSAAQTFQKFTGREWNGRFIELQCETYDMFVRSVETEPLLLGYQVNIGQEEPLTFCGKGASQLPWAMVQNLANIADTKVRKINPEEWQKVVPTLREFIEDIELAWHDLFEICITDIEIEYDAQELRICQGKEWVACAMLEFELDGEIYQTRTCITEEVIKNTVGASV